MQPMQQPMQQPAAPPPAGAMVPAQPAGGVAHQITHGPSFAMLRADLAPGQLLVAEAGREV